MKHSISAAAAALFILLFAAPGAADPSIAVNKAEIIFESVSRGGDYSDSLKIKNTGGGTLQAEIRSSCDCLSANPSRADLPGGHIAVIEVKFKPYSGGENFKGEIFLSSNDPENPYLIIPVTAKAVRAAEAVKPAPPALQEGKLKESRNENTAPPASAASSSVRLKIQFFHSPACPKCDRIKNELIPGLEKKHSRPAEVEQVDISKKENFAALMQTLSEKGMKLEALPVVISGEAVISGFSGIEENLPLLFAGNYRQVKTPKAADGGLRNFSILPIILAGLLDGINPCAFSVLVFLVSFLLYYNIRGRRLLISGTAYIAGVFFIYYLIGAGFMGLLGSVMGTYKKVSLAVKYIIAFSCLVFSALSLYDYFQARKKEYKKILLQLPASVKRRIHLRIGEIKNRNFYFSVFFISGVIVSFFELGCTGQVYLPTITYTIQAEGLTPKAFFYLLIYNLMFIAPLAGVFMLVYGGTSQEKLRNFFSGNMPATKLIYCFLFLLFFLLMIFVS